MTDPITIIIVSYNCCGPLRACLQSLAANTPPHSLPTSGIIVVDNASTDGTAAMVRTEFSSVTLIANEINRGFAAATNQGIAIAGAEYVLLLNPDTIATPTVVAGLLAIMEKDPRIGVCGPRILNPNGSLQPSCRTFPTLGIMMADELGFRGRYRMKGWSHNETREVYQLMGACLLLRRRALDEVGLLDERFFMYFEEVDLCLRLKTAGWKVWFVHDITVTHVGGESSKSDRRACLRHRYHSLFEFYRKHYPAWQLTLLRLTVQVGSLGRIMLGQRDYSVIAREVWRL